MQLAELILDAGVLAHAGPLAVEVRQLTADSRAVEQGDVFVCLPGYRTEGGETRADRHDFIPMALARGARALVVEREQAPIHGVTVVRVADCWAAIAAMSCRFFGNPSSSLRMVGVTGTCGKTSTTYFIDAVLSAAGQLCARLGTVEYRIGSQVWAAAQTTPEAPELQRLLRLAVDRGATAAVMEVSSHALALRRVAGIAFDVAVFTNLSQDHLNFHPDMHHYLRAKGRLFEELASGGKAATAVVNTDDLASAHIIAVNRGRLLTYGIESAADVRARGLAMALDGVSFSADTPCGSLEVSLRHLGEYSVYNALAAIGTGVAMGIPLAQIRAGLAQAPPVPGRFELVDCGQDFGVAVDYAHKPDALERLLASARTLKPKRLITVFGCGGDRDRGKRPLMGRIAARLSDLVIVTSDNPRSEEPAAIIAEITHGLAGSATSYRVEPDRAAAIDLAITLAQPGDLVLIAGKGHETYQLFADRRIEFDDREVARAAIARHR
ncbi:MAG: UDP-N-acetylmuramoyl-L-alanyl-D-glutamate--2,6-diaminopimelate ligase [Deltaproteobacteria bacterium]|nr:UDP-N-acetylmuramoyl-L-alanyl-D-glutamate--2,6-diaminopimelate ligase [Deltaproteobacteria bacterium]